MNPEHPDSKVNSSEESEILKEIENLSQKLGKQFSALKSHIFQTEIEYSSSASFLTPQDTLGKNTTDSFSELPNQTPIFPQEKRYEVRKILGEGGMGVIRLVYDHFLGREVAQKQIKLKSNASGSFSERQKQMFWRLNQEASITAMLEHPNIVPLYEIQQKASGEIQFTMRRIEGRSLRDVIQKMRKGEEKYDNGFLLSVFLKICDAIAYAHSRGVLHRDLKPENIMVGEFGEVYVMDWGIAKHISFRNEKAKPIYFLSG
ncbi:MAG: serine/threonine-protein kinase [Planctomycetota bacterium]